MVLVKPVLIQFWRCGKASRSRAWTTCKTPETCKAEGCQRMEVQYASGSGPSGPEPASVPRFGSHDTGGV